MQYFDSEHGGFPDHRLNYHPHYSPMANLFQGIEGALDDPMSLLGKFAFGGNITLNVFSLNISLDTSSYAVSTIISSLTTETLDLFMDEY